MSDRRNSGNGAQADQPTAERRAIGYQAGRAEEFFEDLFSPEIKIPSLKFAMLASYGTFLLLANRQKLHIRSRNISAPEDQQVLLVAFSEHAPHLGIRFHA